MSLSLGASNRNYGKKQRKAAGDKTYENLVVQIFGNDINKKLQARRNYEETDFGGMSATVNSFPDFAI